MQYNIQGTNYKDNEKATQQVGLSVFLQVGSLLPYFQITTDFFPKLIYTQIFQARVFVDRYECSRKKCGGAIRIFHCRRELNHKENACFLNTLKLLQPIKNKSPNIIYADRKTYMLGKPYLCSVDCREILFSSQSYGFFLELRLLSLLASANIDVGKTSFVQLIAEKPSSLLSSLLVHCRFFPFLLFPRLASH